LEAFIVEIVELNPIAKDIWCDLLSDICYTNNDVSIEFPYTKSRVDWEDALRRVLGVSTH